MSAITQVSCNKIFGGHQKVFSHFSKTLKCSMNFAIYLPPQTKYTKVPVLYWLSGLTCNELNFVQKAGAQRYAAEKGIIIVCPDTSPRNVNIPGEDESWDFGSGAGFYVDATEEAWKEHYNMYSYVTSELIEVINEHFPVATDNQSIFGHSMGGHGAIICALKNPGLYKSVSAFAPISNPMNCPWGKKALTGYLGADGNWSDYDASELVKKYAGPPLEIFIDQGTNDQFYKDKQLLPENLVESCKNAHFPCIFQLREDYDHSYFHIATFVGEHIAYHGKYLHSDEDNTGGSQPINVLDVEQHFA